VRLTANNIGSRIFVKLRFCKIYCKLANGAELDGTRTAQHTVWECDGDSGIWQRQNLTVTVVYGSDRM
jgi:hypothetical protein